MRRFRTLATAGAFLMFAGSAGLAQGTGAEGYFDIHNDTDGNLIVGFYTNDGSGWSDNWLKDAIAPGEKATARFNAPEGACDRTLRAGWAGNDGETEVLDEPINIEICDAGNVYLGDSEINYD